MSDVAKTVRGVHGYPFSVQTIYDGRDGGVHTTDVEVRHVDREDHVIQMEICITRVAPKSGRAYQSTASVCLTEDQAETLRQVLLPQPSPFRKCIHGKPAGSCTVQGCPHWQPEGYKASIGGRRP